MVGSVEFWLGTSFTVLSGAWVYLFSKSQDHEKRIQKLEDVQSTKIEVLIKDVDELKRDVKKLSDYILKAYTK